MRIDKYIAELLFEYDCVIVPGFGGFICNYSSASIHSGKYQFNPPFKKITFNRSLKNNDGLLANHLSQAEKISYSEANAAIAAFVDRINEELITHKRSGLNNIGAFYQREENKLLFEQDMEVNYLAESFGFTSFYSLSIKREPIERKIERHLKDKIIVPSKDQKGGITVRKPVPVMRYVAAAASLLIFVSVLFVSTKTELLQKISIANLNPFSANEEPLYRMPEASPDPDPDAVKDNVNNLLALRNDTLRFLNIMIGGEFPIVVRLKEDAVTAGKSKNKEAKGKKRFHIIGGAFAVTENAEKFKKKLIQLGFDAVIIEKKDSHLQCVSYGSFATREEALQAMEKIRSLQGDAWLMKI